MPAKPEIRPDTRPPAEPVIPEPPNDGFPPDEDISIQPPDSDVNTGVHKKPET